jgi:hypothetical protein
MEPILIAGTTIVNFALISYTLFLYFERKTKVISSRVLLILTLDVVLDILATVCMIIGSSKGAFTWHGFIGYSSLLAMLIDSIFLWKSRLKGVANQPVPDNLHKYTLFAYIWWICAYITGLLLVMAR